MMRAANPSAIQITSALYTSGLAADGGMSALLWLPCLVELRNTERGTDVYFEIVQKPPEKIVKVSEYCLSIHRIDCEIG